MADPSESLGRGIGRAGDAFAQLIYARRQSAVQEENQRSIEELWGNILKEPEPSPTGAPAGPDPFSGVRQMFKGMDKKTLARVMGSQAFTPQGLKALASIGAGGGGAGAMLTGEQLQQLQPNLKDADLKGYVFQQGENGEWIARVTPKRPVVASPGQVILDATTMEPKARIPERLQLANISQGGQLRLVDMNNGDNVILGERASAPSGGGGGGEKRFRVTVQGVGPNGEPTTRTLEYLEGTGGQPSRLIGEVATGEKPMTEARAGRITGSRQGVALVQELRDTIMPGGKVDRQALVSKALRLPGVVAPKGAGISPKLLQAIDPYVRATTGAALNEQELKNAATMFDPSALDSDEMIGSKLDRLEEFLSGNVSLLTSIAVPGSAVSKALAAKNAPQAAAPATGSAPSIQDLLKQYGPKK